MASPWEGLTLEEKVGQLLMFGFEGSEPSGAARHLVTERHAGGVILFYRNIREARHVTELTSALQSLARLPLLISADQEGGSVLRVRQGASLLPSAMGSARLGPEGVFEVARICGLEMSAMGLNINLAPVLDVNERDNPGVGIRSFSESPREAAGLAEPYVRGLQGAGVLACAKHFPGKGAARLDAHLDLPVIDRGLDELRSHELLPFRSAFATGAAAAMTSHCVYSQVDDRPATLSRRILTDLLRRELGFDGILITDDLEMGAISRYHEGTSAAVAAFEAGADVILICKDTTLACGSLDAIATAIRSGRIPEARLDESLARIRKAKERIGAPPAESVDELHARHSRSLDRLCDRIVEVDRDPGLLLPLSGRSVDLYWPNMSVLTRVEEGSTGLELLERGFKARFSAVRILPYDPREPATGAGDGETSVFFSANAHLFPAQARLIQTVRGRGRPFVLVALRNPYDRDLVTRKETVVLSYGFLPNALGAVLKRILRWEGP
jgi:beta-N-acetylhexosaminidase